MHYIRLSLTPNYAWHNKWGMLRNGRQVTMHSVIMFAVLRHRLRNKGK